METRDTHIAAEAVFRIERTRLIAGLTRMVRDIGLAEELAQDALVAALSDWPKRGVPANPAAWLMATAKRRAIDQLRRRSMLERKHQELALDLDGASHHDPIGELEQAMDDDIGDERLSLMFTACHPVLSREARVALTLRLVGGLTTEEISRAFLTSEPTIAQRIVRAKKALGSSGASYAVPRGDERGLRLAAVLEVIYLIFNEGYAASSGEDAIRPSLCNEAMRLGRILVALAPDEPEVLGLLALMEIQASRLNARTGPHGETLTLEHQNRARWDLMLIRRGLAALDRVQALGGRDGAYALQAELAACHARARSFQETDWFRISGLYDRLLKVMPSPVVALNRAIAYSMAKGPMVGLALLAELEAEPALQRYAPLSAAKADCLMRAGQKGEARSAFKRAASLSRNKSERAFLQQRAEECGRS
ncbi:RNA polymerase sigma factor [Rhizobium sp. RU36D]|uniref:RNA polymerase sigma factor n=1 Tax=Rhizobium sp. RU36D TaxID=1907415 RepID=UPI0009D84556|nr:RNA polymerase sigma factor [Rhizobium sp. RU36D]SMD20084.1 RNA polymerase, sigma subunit, ECF family [Rhizobium sp. RU36D]